MSKPISNVLLRAEVESSLHNLGSSIERLRKRTGMSVKQLARQLTIGESSLRAV